MEIETEYKHLAKLQMKLAAEAVIKRQDRELIKQFGTVEQHEEEYIWEQEQRAMKQIRGE